jgi:predicted RNA-binding protein with PUA-like domain
MATQRYWLMKSEPGTYSIDDLKRDKQTAWDGVRNYQARNLMRDDMHIGDPVLFYHSSTDPAAVVGLAKVASKPYPDPSQFDRKSKYYDPKSDPQQPRWYLVDVAFKKKFKNIVPLTAIRTNPALADMKLVQRGMRLSVQPVSAREWQEILKMAGEA